MNVKEGVIVVGTRPTLPNLQVENESENSLRFRSSQFPSPEAQSSLADNPAYHATTSTPADAEVLGVHGRKSPSFGTPGSMSGFSPVDLYMTPPSHVEDTSITSEISEVKINLNQNNEFDSGYGNNSSKRAIFNPCQNPEGSYISKSSSSIWEQLFSPAKELKWRWKTKPRFIADSEGNIMDEFGVDQQQVLGFLVLMIVSASLGFALLASFRNMNEDSLMERNGKYDSIGFGRQKILERSRKEGRVIEEVRDEFGNLLGGKKAAIQFSFDISRSTDNDEGRIIIQEGGDSDLASEEQKQVSGSEVLENVFVQENSDQGKEILKTASELKVKDIEVKKLAEEVRELDDNKKQKLELLKKIKAFDVKVAKIREQNLPGKKIGNVGKDQSGNVEIPKKMKSKKSKANPLLKSMAKLPKVTKVKFPRNSPVA